MERKKRGFTLVELLAVIVILGVLLGIAIPAVLGYMNLGKEKYYLSLEDSVLNSARDYLNDYRSLYPREIGAMATISGEELINNRYIEKIDDEEGNACDARVLVEKTGRDEYDYTVCLTCGDHYSSNYSICENGGGSGETSGEYEIEVDDFPTEVRQGDDLTLPKGKVYVVKNGNRKLVTDNLASTPKTIDTTVLGSTNVRWVYRYKSTNPKTVRVVDKVAPERPTVKLTYADGTEYKPRNSNGNINIASSSIVMEITSRDYACLLGTTCRSRYPDLDGSGIKEIRYQGETDTSERVIPTSKTTTRYVENNSIWGNVVLHTVDNSNNQSENTSFEIYLDNQKPAKTIVTYLGGSNSHSWKNDYKLKLSSSDDADIAYYEIYIDGVFYETTDAEWVPPNNFSSCNTTFRAVDLAGNKGDFSDSQHIHMDTEKPALNSNKWGEVTSEVAKLYVKTSDNASGIENVRCKTSTEAGGFTNYHWFDAVWDEGENSYRCDITTDTFGHYGQTYQTQIHIYDKANNGGAYNTVSVDIPGMEWNYQYNGSDGTDGSAQVWTTPYSGNYQFELWGAQGSGSNGGKGGYTKGTIHLTEGQQLYMFIGGQPQRAAGGYNGGGTPGERVAAYNTGGGGGATDIRTVNEQTEYAYKRRIMVAGGGGAGGSSSSGSKYGYGGGLTGGDGYYDSSLYCPNESGYQNYVDGCFARPASGAKPDGAGSGGKASVNNYNNIWYVSGAGSFYFGGGRNSGSCSGDYCIWSQGGGGGWYGGGAGANTTLIAGGGAGGSSFISGHPGCVAVNGDMQPIGNVSLTGLAFTNTAMESGVNSGHGKIKVTLVSRD